MKTIKFLSMMLVLMMMPLVSSCGGDDDNSGADGGGGTPPTGKRIVKIKINSAAYNFTYEFTYDGQGRVYSMEDDKDKKGNRYRYTLTYSDNKIVVNKYLYYSNSLHHDGDFEYTLENELIVNREDSHYSSYNANYSYENGHLTTIFDYDSRKISWSGDNIMSVTEHGTTSKFEYSNILAPNYHLIHLVISGGTDMFLNVLESIALAPYFGKTSKNLPSKRIDDYVSGNEVFYDWTMRDGLPIQCTVTKDGKSTPLTIYTYEWQ